MKFRPCIDLHEGKVKQIVGSTYRDDSREGVAIHFETQTPSSFFAAMYRDDVLDGGHVVMLGPGNETAALDALAAYPGGLQVGGGVVPATAVGYLDAGASHVIVTSYVFREGHIDWAHLSELKKVVGRSRLVLDVSCMPDDAGGYVIVTDRWQRRSRERLNGELLGNLSASCAEFLVHAAHVEGRQQGVDAALVRLLVDSSPIPVTYAGGVRTFDDLEVVEQSGTGRVDVTVGSALDIFGGPMRYRELVAWNRERNPAPGSCSDT